VHQNDLQIPGSASSFGALLLHFSELRRLQAAVDVHLSGVIHVEHSSPGPGSQLRTSGSLILRQQNLLTAGSSFVDTDDILLRYNSTDPYELVGERIPVPFLVPGGAGLMKMWP
jgi:hypothetical protein